jgi:hypothetical protein
VRLASGGRPPRPTEPHGYKKEEPKMILILLWLLGAPLVLIILLFLLGIGH